MAFVLTFLQIAAKERLGGGIEQGLRAFAMGTRKPAGQDEKESSGDYGAVLPLALAPPASNFPPPMQPRRMSAIFRAK